MDQRIQDVDKCGSMSVVLCEKAQRKGGHWVVAPRPVQLHKQLGALLGICSKRVKELLFSKTFSMHAIQ